MDSTATSQTKVSTPGQKGRKILLRIVTLIAVAALLGFLMRHLSVALERSPRPAGFWRGVLQGALMPAALPSLLVGSDVIIYSQNNAGVIYKLGYTLGVNTCGAFFFGMFFWRVNRWRKGNAKPE